MSKSTLEIVGCPGCTSPAEVAERFVLESTHGPIEHAVLECLRRHRFTVLAERLVSPSSGSTRLDGHTPPNPGERTAWRHP